jgi:arylsulfatase A-like enzyme
VTRNARAFEPVYAAVIETLDETVGLLLGKIDALGLRTNTIVVFTSDNGGLHVPEGGHRTITHNTPFRAGKGFLYEGGLRVPLLVRWPGKIAEGKSVDTPVINTDWYPTLIELIGAAAPGDVDGKSFAALLLARPTADPGQARQRRLFWHFPHYTNQGSRPGGSVREGNWKLIEHYDTEKLELYDLAHDAGETNDLARVEPDRARKMQAQLADWRRSVGAQTNARNPNFDPALYKILYEDTDVSSYEPARADAATLQKLLAWRRQMNAVVAREGRPDALRSGQRRNTP